MNGVSVTAAYYKLRPQQLFTIKQALPNNMARIRLCLTLLAIKDQRRLVGYELSTGSRCVVTVKQLVERLREDIAQYH